MGSKISYSYEKPNNYHENSRAEMVRYVPQTARKTLEFGCGCGMFSELLKNAFDNECWGVEIDDRAARIASKKLDRVIKCDATESLGKLPDRYFDCIIFNDTLEHLPDPFHLLQSIKKKLTSEGVVVASIPNVRFWNNLRDLVWRGDWDYKEAGILDITHLRFFTYKSLLKILQGLRYEVLCIEGLRPTHSTKFKILNFLLCNKLWDAKYHQFACVIKPVAGW